MNHKFLCYRRYSIALFVSCAALLFSPIYGSDVFSFRIDYKETYTDLCQWGKFYKSKKSTWGSNGEGKPNHPYTLFYHAILRDKKHSNITMANLGKGDGGSLLMWRKFLPEANLYGFDSDQELMNQGCPLLDSDRIPLYETDITDRWSLENSFLSAGVHYDLIIGGDLETAEDQLQVIQEANSYLKPGGMLVIENILKNQPEQTYLDALSPLLDRFQDCYFLSMAHNNLKSNLENNNKLLVLIKKGAPPIFKNSKKLTIITPCIRPGNLSRLKESINFDYVAEWIIVYDIGKLIKTPFLFPGTKTPKIKEYLYAGQGSMGNPQRNYALDHMQNEDTYLYFLDDDNTIHPHLFKLIDILDENNLVTFNQTDRLLGNQIALNRIDTAMYLIDANLCRGIRWNPYKYAADFYFINDCYQQNKNRWIYVDNNLSSYNIIK